MQQAGGKGTDAAGLERALRLEGAERDALVEAGLANVARYDWADHARTLLATIDDVRGASAAGGTAR